MDEALRDRAIEAMQRAARVLEISMNLSRGQRPDSQRTPYDEDMLVAITRDIRTLRLFAQEVCPHPNDSYASDDNDVRSYCTLCNKKSPKHDDA